MKYPFPKFINFIWFQSIWFLAIIGGDKFSLVLFVMIILHLVLCQSWKTEAKVLLCCAGLGVAIDSVFTLQGLFQFDSESSILPVPYWLMAIWLGFAGTLRHSTEYLIKRPLLMAIMAGISAPLSYAGGMRLDAVTFPYALPLTLMCISLAWMALIPVLVRIIHYLDYSSGTALNHKLNVKLHSSSLVGE